jgi:hypothetical protein
MIANRNPRTVINKETEYLKNHYHVKEPHECNLQLQKFSKK